MHELLELLRSAWVSELMKMILNCDCVVHSTNGMGYVAGLRCKFYYKPFKVILRGAAFIVSIRGMSIIIKGIV